MNKYIILLTDYLHVNKYVQYSKKRSTLTAVQLFTVPLNIKHSQKVTKSKEKFTLRGRLD